MLYNYNMTTTIITYYNYTFLSTSWFKWASEYVRIFSGLTTKCPTHPSSVWSSLEAPGMGHGPFMAPWGNAHWIWHVSREWIWLNMIEYDWIWLNMIEYDWIWLNMIEYDWIWLNMIEYDWIWHAHAPLLAWKHSEVWSSHMQHRTSSHSINDGGHDGSNHHGHGHDALDLVFEWYFSRQHTKWQDPNVSISINKTTTFVHILTHISASLHKNFAVENKCRSLGILDIEKVSLGYEKSPIVGLKKIDIYQ